jgi:mono/diheme cytochrome c family protein
MRPVQGSIRQQLPGGPSWPGSANCSVCHTRAGGSPYSGGRPIETPLGVLFSTNITPHLKTGIGGWSRAAFARAMREGVDRRGRHLYPVFPYDHFTKLEEADIDALYAFLMTREPVADVPPSNRLMLPFRFRPLLAVWKALFLDKTPPPAVPSKSEDWSRGAYLVEALAHCGAFHTPRNLLQASKRDEPFAGGKAENWQVPALDARSPAPVRLRFEDILAYLQLGSSPTHGLAVGPMAEVAQSLANVPAGDVRAIATYVASFSGSAARGGAGGARVRRAPEKRNQLGCELSRSARAPGGKSMVVNASSGSLPPRPAMIRFEGPSLAGRQVHQPSRLACPRAGAAARLKTQCCLQVRGLPGLGGPASAAASRWAR